MRIAARVGAAVAVVGALVWFVFFSAPGKSVLDWFVGVGHTSEEWILAQVESVWIYFGLYGVSFLDAVFPVVPSESVVIALSATWAQTGAPILAFVWIAAALGAWTGDQVTYTIGTLINVRKVPGMGTRRGRAMLDWAEHALENRGTSFIIAARFIPGGRVAVNLTAGALRFPRRRFMGVAAIAAVIWATWGVVLGVTAGNAFEGNLFLSIAIGVAGGVALGYLVDILLSRFGIEPPDLPDIDELPERHLTKKGREEEKRRQAQLERESAGAQAGAKRTARKPAAKKPANGKPAAKKPAPKKS